MTKIIKITAILMLLIIILLNAPSCAQAVSQEEYDRVINELSEAEDQIKALQNKVAEAVSMEAQYKALSTELETIEVQYAELNTKFEELQKQNKDYISEIATIDAQYAELKRQYDLITQPPEEIREEDIEQALFELINQERIDNGVDELLWGKYLYDSAEVNSRAMAETGEYQYSGRVSWQEIYWAIGYKTTDRLVNATLVMWKTNNYRYSQNILNKGAKYGAVAVHKLGEIYYITYMASFFK